MNTKEALILLGWSREDVRIAIVEGVKLPASGTIQRLKAVDVDGDFEIAESDLENFEADFEKEAPGRHPPIAVRRQLLVEARHKCAICREWAPRYQFHHILEFAKLRHHDPRHMLAICGTCHDSIGHGHIDQASQRMYKQRLESDIESELGELNIGWEDLREVIVGLSNSLDVTNPGESRFDFCAIDLNDKNRLNHLSDHYFDMMKLEHEPYFFRIDAFLCSPVNEDIAFRYHQVVDEIRTQIALAGDGLGAFQVFLQKLFRAAIQSGEPALRRDRKALNVLLSYMYFKCDIGRKS